MMSTTVAPYVAAIAAAVITAANLNVLRLTRHAADRAARHARATGTTILKPGNDGTFHRPTYAEIEPATDRKHASNVRRADKPSKAGKR